MTTTDITAVAAQALKGERDRIDAIRTICNGEFPEIEKVAVGAGWAPEVVTKKVLETLRAERIAVGTRIRDRRMELAATMPDFEALALSRRLGITAGHLYQIETGRVRASAGLLSRIGRTLAMDVNRLLAANGQIAPGLEAALIARPERWAEIERGLA